MDLTTNSSTPSSYIFPLLKHSDILQCMSELGIEMNKAELAEPIRHKERVRKVFLQLLDICCGQTEDDFQPSPAMLEAAAACPFPQLHEDFSDMKFYKSLRKCMKTCGIHDFGWKDLHYPTAKRFRCQLSAAINMAKFREDQLKLYAELNAPRAEMLLALEEINQENALLNEQLEKTKMESNTKFQEMDQVERDCEELEIEIARNNKLQAAKREEATELKRQANDLKDDLATATLALQEAQAEYDTLNAQVVSSPSRRKYELQSQKNALEGEKQELKALDDKLQLNKTKIVHVNQAIRDVPEITNFVEQVLEVGQKLKQVKEQIGEASSEKETIDKKTEDILDEMEESQGALNRTEEKLSHARKQTKVKMDAAQEALEAANAQLLMVEKDHREGMARVEAGEAEVRSMEAQIEQERQKTQEEIDLMIQEYRMTENHVLEENAKLMKAIGVA